MSSLPTPVGAAASERAPSGAPADVGDDVVRAFMLTGGRTRALVPELPIETLVAPGSKGAVHAARQQHDQRRILGILDGAMSIAEISAHLMIPLRAAVILVSEMVSAGALQSGDSVDAGDTDLLYKIRSALQLL